MHYFGDVEPRGGIWTRDHYLTKHPIGEKLPNAGFASDFWLDYQSFTCNEYRHEYAMDIVKKARKYSQCLKSGNVSELKCFQLRRGGE